MSDDATRRIRDLLNPQQRENVKYAYGRAMAFACSVLKLDKPHAEEVVHEATLHAIERIDRYQARPGVPFVAWFNKVLLNLVMDQHRHRQRTERLQDLAGDATIPPEETPPDLRLANAQAQVRRDQLLAILSPEVRKIFSLWAQQNARYIDRAEAASRLGCSILEYEAAKKRARTAVENAMQRLGVVASDLMSELPRVSNAKPTRQRGEEDDR